MWDSGAEDYRDDRACVSWAPVDWFPLSFLFLRLWVRAGFRFLFSLSLDPQTSRCTYRILDLFFHVQTVSSSLVAYIIITYPLSLSLITLIRRQLPFLLLYNPSIHRPISIPKAVHTRAHSILLHLSACIDSFPWIGTRCGLSATFPFSALTWIYRLSHHSSPIHPPHCQSESLTHPLVTIKGVETLWHANDGKRLRRLSSRLQRLSMTVPNDQNDQS